MLQISIINSLYLFNYYIIMFTLSNKLNVLILMYLKKLYTLSIWKCNRENKEYIYYNIYNIAILCGRLTEKTHIDVVTPYNWAISKLFIPIINKKKII